MRLRVVLRGNQKYANPAHLLRAGGNGPCRSRAADKRDEFSSFHC
jgi:hypothetical protein